jgi:hypothetical protein
MQGANPINFSEINLIFSVGKTTSDYWQKQCTLTV